MIKINKKLAWMTLTLLVLNMLTAFLIVPTENVKADPPLEGDNWWVYPQKQPYQIYAQPQFNWSKFWKVFKNHALWGLEYNDGSGWEWVNQSLEVGVIKRSNNERKLWLNFTAPYTGDYRLTFAIDYKVKKYVEKIGQYAYNLSFEVFNEEFNVTFDFSDIASVPGIIMNHGVVNRNGNKYFYLRARKNNINQGVHYSIDPSYTVYSGSNVNAYYSHSINLVRCSNGTYLVCFEENDDVHIAWSEDSGETWSDKEVYGARTCWTPTVCVDSNDIVHLVWMGLSDADTNDYQIRYCNSSAWGTITDIVDADYHHYYPAIAVDSNDVLHVVYELDDSHDSEIGYLNSTDNGDTWSAPTYITSEAHSSDDNWKPSIAIDSNDVLHVVYCWEDGISNIDAIMHMQSNDAGDTWSDWDGDTIAYVPSKNSRNPVIVIDDNDKLHIIWNTYEADFVTTAIGYSHNDSSGWSNYEWVVGADSPKYSPSISIQGDNNYVHGTWYYGNSPNVINHSYNDTTSWSAVTTLIGGGASHPTMLCSQYPTIGGVKTNRPKTGYAIILQYGTDSANVTFYKSSDLTWDTAVAGGNNPPDDASNPNPSNGSTDVTRVTPCLNLNATVTDPDGDTMNVTWWSNSTGSWAKFGTNNSVANNTNIIQCNSNMTSYSTEYWWSVNMSDGEGGWRNSTFSFTLEDEPDGITIEAESPSNTSTGVSVSLASTSAIVNHSIDDSLTNVSFWTNASGSWVLYNETLGSDPNWWDTDWDYYKVCNVNNKREGYQMKIKIGNSTGGDVNLGGNLGQGNFTDIRFLAIDNSTEYNHWMENYTADDQATFWVNNSDNASQILLYYGHSSCGNTTFKNGTNTFIWFDDFNGNNLNPNKWENDWSWGGGGTVSVSGGTLSMTITAGKGEGVRSYDGSKVKNFTVPYALRWRSDAYTPDTKYTGVIIQSLYVNPSHNHKWKAGMFGRDDYGDTGVTIEGTGATSSQDALTINDGYNIFEIMCNASGTQDFYLNDTLVDDDHDQSSTAECFIDMAIYNGADTYNVDWIMLRNYTYIEPSWNSFGSEQEDLGTLGNGTFWGNDTSWVVDYDTTYWWSVNATDGTLWTNATFHFTTGSAVTITITSMFPNNHSTDIDLQPTLFATFAHGNGSMMTIYWYNDTDLLGTETKAVNGTYTVLFYNCTVRNTEYTINIKVNDTWALWQNETYYFTTEGIGSTTGGGGGSGNRNVIGIIGIIGILGLFGGLMYKRRED